MNDITQVTEVARGISDYGILVIIGAVYLILSASMMVAIFKWFKTIITQIMEDNREGMQGVLSETRKQNELLNDLAEGLRSETQLRIKTVSGVFFENSMEKVCRLIKQVREENHIADHEATAEKIRKSLTVLHEDRNSKFDLFTYRGVRVSSFCDAKWIEQVADVVMSEIYHEDGANNGRAYTNVKLAYEKIRTEFYHNLTK